MSQLRAVEHGRAVLIAATSGVTAMINPAGHITEQAPTLVPTYIVDDVPLRDTITVADRVGAWPEWAVFHRGIRGITYGSPSSQGETRREGEPSAQP